MTFNDSHVIIISIYIWKWIHEHLNRLYIQFGDRSDRKWEKSLQFNSRKQKLLITTAFDIRERIDWHVQNFGEKYNSKNTDELFQNLN